MNISGTHINYYFHCKRHLWYYLHNIRMEDNSEDVAMGKFISETTYKRKKHEVKIDDIVLDFYDHKTKTIHEVKKSDKMEQTHIWQVKYYIYVLESKGIEGVKGKIDYPKQRKTLDVELTEKDKARLETISIEIKELKNSETVPEVINKPFCKNCAYFELCYV